eukprot:5328323-Pyramimonas_sp.AAC.1
MLLAAAHEICVDRQTEEKGDEAISKLLIATNIAVAMVATLEGELNIEAWKEKLREALSAPGAANNMRRLSKLQKGALAAEQKRIDDAGINSIYKVAKPLLQA